MDRPALHMLVPIAIEVVTLLVVAATVHTLVASLKGARLRAEEKANTDPLTGARSRACLLEELHLRIASDEASNGLILFDLDHFKRINDTKGHVAGDLVLQAVVSRVREVVRDRDVIGRWPAGRRWDGLDDEQTLLAIGEKLRTSVCHRPVAVPGGEVVPTISAVASAPVLPVRNTSSIPSRTCSMLLKVSMDFIDVIRRHPGNNPSACVTRPSPFKVAPNSNRPGPSIVTPVKVS